MADTANDGDNRVVANDSSEMENPQENGEVAVVDENPERDVSLSLII